MGTLRFFQTFVLNKRGRASKFVLVIAFVLVSIYFMSGSFHVQEQEEDFKGVLHKETLAMKRQVLNTNEDNYESLKAPTTKLTPRRLKLRPTVSESGVDYFRAPVPARQAREGNQNPASDNGAQIGGQRSWNKPLNESQKAENSYNRQNTEPDEVNQIHIPQEQKSSSSSTSSLTVARGSSSKSTSTPPHSSSRKHSDEYYYDYEQNVKKKQMRKSKDTKYKKVITSKWKKENEKATAEIEKDNNVGPTPIKTFQLNVTSPVEKPKVKQWESYDYENPYNLLQIHVDRAPEHASGAGQPWPLPQSYLTEPSLNIVDMDNFRIVKPRESCARVDRAIGRYTAHINSKVDLFVPDGSVWSTPRDVSKVLKVLKVFMSRACQDGDLPHEHMSEQYKLTVNSKGAELSAQEPWGVIRGLETFSQLMHFHQGFAVVNTTYIKDYPRFRFRGLMMDTARHYIPIRHLKRQLDAMSYNKLNVFHWHMVDDQSFPFMSKAFPKLGKLGAYSSTEIYTHADILDLIDYAADRAIRIVPEFDSPGHTRSWGLGYPRLLTNCSADFFPFGAVNPISNYTYQFMNRLWAEIHDLFPDSTVHVGGDEINYKCWLRLKKIREFMIHNNMTADQYDYMTLDGDKLQGYYLKHLLDVMPKDRKKIAWEEAFNAAQIWNVSTDELIINVWKGGDYEWQYTMENVIRHGYKAILSAPWYLNYISYGRDWTKYYESDPHSFLMYSSGSDAYKEYVLGGQVCMWAEFISEANLEPTLWPRASAPAEKLWSSAMTNDWRKAEARFENHRCRMFRRGLKTQPNSGPGSCKGNMKIKPPYDANQPYN